MSVYRRIEAGPGTNDNIVSCSDGACRSLYISIWQNKITIGDGINILGTCAVEIYGVAVVRKRTIIGPVAADIHRRGISAGEGSVEINLHAAERGAGGEGAGLDLEQAINH